MPDGPAEILKQAREKHQSLKDALKTKEPVTREAEYLRRDLRRLYLRLLLVHPSAKEAKDAETHLWMQTSYALISRYKARVGELDRAAHATTDSDSAPPRGNDRAAQHAAHGGPVEYRKLLGRFRQFLAEEEKFWAQVVVRLERAHGLAEARSALNTLGLFSDPEAAPAPDAGRGRGPWSEFPPEGDSEGEPPATREEREARLSILGKALVCLGDLARYREQYNESGGRPRAGREDGPPALAPRRGRNRRGPGPAPADLAGIPRERNYERAQRFYESARLLVPNEGNASHQIAILASYRKDVFVSLVHYYRALCVRHPYEPAAENMKSALGKAFDAWRGARRREKEAGRRERPPLPTPKVRLDAIKEEVVVLHARWTLGAFKDTQALANYSHNIAKQYRELVSERIMPINTIVDIITLAQGALFKHRTVRDPRAPSGTSASLEHAILSHLLSVTCALWKIGIAEMADALHGNFDSAAGEESVAQRITAAFRRTLPALRVASKWVRANAQYLVRVESDAPKDVKDIVHTSWKTFAKFSAHLTEVFPAETLPTLSMALQEDVAMRGYLPLRRLMVGDAKDGELVAGEDGNLPGQNPGLHPNEEQLMRIADLLQDAHEVVKVEEVPVLATFTFGTPRQGNSTAQANRIENPPFVTEVAPNDDDDDVATIATTEDDPVGDAFRTNLEDVDDGGLDDDEDEILWDPRPSTSPIKSPIRPIIPLEFSTSSQFTSPQNLPRALAPTSIPSPSTSIPSGVPRDALAQNAGTTAADLLNMFMNPGRPLGQSSEPPRPREPAWSPGPARPTALPPPLHPTNNSIWSTAIDAGPPTLQGLPGGRRPSMSPPRHDASQASWFTGGGASQDTHFSSQPMPVAVHPFSGMFEAGAPSQLPSGRVPDGTLYGQYDTSTVPRNEDYAALRRESYAPGFPGTQLSGHPRFDGLGANAHQRAGFADPTHAFRGGPLDGFPSTGQGMQSYIPNPVSHYPAHAR